MKSKFTLQVVFVSLSALVLTCNTIEGHKSEPTQFLLRVINLHFSVGKRIPSNYLIVYSDGSVECHSIKLDEHDKDDVKRVQLNRDDFAKLTTALSDTRLGELRHEYKLQRIVVGSWMEWDITMAPSHRRTVKLSFAGGSGSTALPEALGKLGCLILDLRRSAYGDDTSYYNPGCLR